MKPHRQHIPILDYEFKVYSEDAPMQRLAIAAMVVHEPPVTPKGAYVFAHIVPKPLPDGSLGYAVVVIGCDQAPGPISAVDGDCDE